MLHRTDLRLAVLILAVCAALYYATAQFEEVSELLAQNIQPQFFPRLLIWTIVVLTLLLPLEHLYLRRQGKDIDRNRRERLRPMTLVTAALLLAVVASMLLVGTFLSMILVCVLLPVLWGERRIKVLIPYALLFPGAVTLLFSQVLKVHFEPGLLGPVLH